MVGLRLFLPETWTGDEARLERAGVPAQYRSARAKSEIALAELDRLIAAGVRFGTVLADAGYGMGAEFRQALSARGLAWAVGIPRHHKVYPRDVELVFPVAPRGRPRKRHVPNIFSVSALDMLTQRNGACSLAKGNQDPCKLAEARDQFGQCVQQEPGAAADVQGAAHRNARHSQGLRHPHDARTKRPFPRPGKLLLPI